MPEPKLNRLAATVFCNPDQLPLQLRKKNKRRPHKRAKRYHRVFRLPIALGLFPTKQRQCDPFGLRYRYFTSYLIISYYPVRATYPSFIVTNQLSRRNIYVWPIREPSILLHHRLSFWVSPDSASHLFTDVLPSPYSDVVPLLLSVIARLLPLSWICKCLLFLWPILKRRIVRDFLWSRCHVVTDKHSVANALPSWRVNLWLSFFFIVHLFISYFNKCLTFRI